MRGATTSITIRNMVAGFSSNANTTEGIWTNTGSNTVVLGSVHSKASEEVDETTTGQRTEERNVVCRIPLSAPITHGDEIIISGVHSVLNGTYEVESLLYTRTHVRAECKRTMR